MARGFKTGGRQKGTPNKTTTQLKEIILAAAEAAHDEGALGYLTQQAQENPAAFMTLLGKVLPTQIDGDVAVTHILPRPLTAEEWAQQHGASE